MKYIKNKDLIKGIQNQDLRILENIYSENFTFIKHFILDNSGSEQDAKDVFQDAIIIIYRKIKEGGFELTVSFKTYLYSVCRLIWLKELEKRNKRSEISITSVEFENIQDVTQDDLERNRNFKLYQFHFKRLSKDCQTILQLFLNKVSLKDIAIKLGIDSVQYVKKKKYKCKEQLVRYIKSDPKFENDGE